MEDIKRINLNEVQYKVTDEDVRTKYPTLDELPSINGQPVVGDLTLSQLGIQPQGEYARYTEVPQRVSELSNDLEFQSRTEVHDMIMDELSNFEVASFEVVDEIPTPATAREGVRYFYSNPTTGKVEEYIKIGSEVVMVGSSAEIDLSNYYNKTETDALLNAKANITDVPVRVSDLNNDRGFITKTVTDLQYYTKTTDMNAALNLKADKTEIPTKTSQLTNDSGYITKSVNNLENYTKTTDLNTALNLKADKTTTYTKTEVDNLLPTKTSQLTNDSGYIIKSVNDLENYYTKTEIEDRNFAEKSTTYTKTEINNLNKQLAPSGSITQYAGSTAPSGWLFCRGQAISRTTYANLFAVIGTTYGEGNGSTTFNLPNLQGRVPVGLNSGTFNELNKKGGAETVTLTKAQTPKVTGTMQFRRSGTTANTFNITDGDGTVFSRKQDGDVWTNVVAHATGTNTAKCDKITFDNQGESKAHNNLQPYITLNYIIKT